MPVRKLELFADYHQFYLMDEGAVGDLSDSWTQAATDRMLACADGAIGVMTARNMDVHVEVDVVESAPSDGFAEWDIVNECSIDVPSGRLVVAGCTDYRPDAVRIEVPPGICRVRVYYGGLDSLSDDGLDGEDRYRVVLWSGTSCSAITLKGRGPTN